MKKSKIVLVSLFILATGFTSGQSLEATTYIERTHISPKMGTAVGVVFDNAIEVGGFYQLSSEALNGEKNLPTYIEQEMYGAFVACPLLGNQRGNVKLNIRTGVVNGENFVITPSVRGNIQIANLFSLGAGVGVRNFRPTMMATFKINI